MFQLQKWKRGYFPIRVFPPFRPLEGYQRWSFGKHILLLSLIREVEVPNQIPLFKVPFWIKVHNLPVGFISMVVGQSIANFLGEYLDYDEKNASNPWRSYMKIQVLLVDVRQHRSAPRIFVNLVKTLK